MGVSVTQLLIILVIVIVLFGTKRLRNLGSDLGTAIKSFRSAVKDGEEGAKLTETDDNTIDSTVTSKDDKKV